MIARHEHITPGPAEALAAEFREHVPTLATARLKLRAVHITDFDAFAEIVCGDRGKHIGGPMSREDAWYDFACMSSGWMLHGHGGWSVEDAADGSLLGFVVLGLEPGDLDVELGFLFREMAEGKGYAFEAATVVRDWAFRELKLSTLASYVDDANTRSKSLAERLGGKRDKKAEAEIGDKQICVFRHSQSEGTA